MTIRSKIFVSLVGIAVASIFLVGIVGIYQASSTVENLARERIENISNFGAEYLSDQREREIRDARARTVTVTQAAVISDGVLMQYEIDPSLGYCFLIGRNGRLARSPSTGRLALVPEAEIYPDFESMDFWRPVINTRAPVIIDEVRNDFGVAAVAILAPIWLPFEGGETFAAIFGREEPVESFFEDIGSLRVSPHGSLFVLGSSGVIFGSNGGGRVSPEILAGLLEGTTIFDGGGERYIASVTAVPGSEWRVAVVSPLTDFTGGLAWIKWGILLLVLIVASLSGMAAKWIARRLGEPIELLVEGAKRLGAGDLDHRMNIIGKDEIAGLAEAFNEMARDLKKALDELAETERIRKELEIAHEIQSSMLSVDPPEIPGLDIFAVSVPAREVGGDLYDLIGGKGTLTAVLGDVSGKGVPAALHMTMTRILVRALFPGSSGTSDLMLKVNRELLGNMSRSHYVTALALEMDSATGDVVYTSAGHPPPILISSRNDYPVELAIGESGILGRWGDLELEEKRVRLEKGDVLVIYSDGISEARNPEGEFCGEEGVMETCAGLAGKSAREIGTELIAWTDSFAGGKEPHDDRTLIVIRYDGGR